LWGVYGRKIAASSSFAYSAQMRAAQGSWDVGTLDRYLERPRLFMDETKMTFAGVLDPQERADLIAFLNALSANPTSLSLPDDSGNRLSGQGAAKDYSLFGKPAIVEASIYPATRVGEIDVRVMFDPQEISRLLTEKYGASHMFSEGRNNYYDSRGELVNKITWSYWKLPSGMVILLNSDGGMQSLAVPPQDWQGTFSEKSGFTWIQFLGPEASKFVLDRAVQGDVRSTGDKEAKAPPAISEHNSPSDQAKGAASEVGAAASPAAREAVTVARCESGVAPVDECASYMAATAARCPVETAPDEECAALEAAHLAFVAAEAARAAATSK
jgi:hypothetical protein